MDIGCGTGNVTNALREKIPHEKFHAFDKDPDMIAFAVGNNQSPDTITYVIDDIATPWENLCQETKSCEGQVDLAFSNYVLHWITDIQQVMENLTRLLKPGGVFYLNVIGMRPICTLLPESLKYLKLGTIQSQLEEMVVALKNAGLRVNRHHIIEDKWHCRSDKEYATFLKIVPNCYLVRIEAQVWKSIDTQERERMTGEIAKAAHKVYEMDAVKVFEEGQDSYGISYNGFRVEGMKEAIIDSQSK
ncbi:Malonyl-[acyl-carrier protein] O-methyltransferase [Folsomia candida]|uniref:Malonyl-[acyl-carrier protein] O-methyltransferase n=2 Tax=Folsomia candida TaxID=158441 RepID=A0A226DT82_FOLCA|nr:Malonyl-[acyl-carrier protein] O-methyltransferase [Folsomia candida]